MRSYRGAIWRNISRTRRLLLSRLLSDDPGDIGAVSAVEVAAEGMMGIHVVIWMFVDAKVEAKVVNNFGESPFKPMLPSHFAICESNGLQEFLDIATQSETAPEGCKPQGGRKCHSKLGFLDPVSLWSREY